MPRKYLYIYIKMNHVQIFGRGLKRVEKVFFDTLETVEKATKPSEPHSARAGSQSAVLSIALNLYQSKTERKTSSHRKTLLRKMSCFDGSGSFSAVWNHVQKFGRGLKLMLYVIPRTPF